ncbi:hypothetical protein N431DRAFT_444839 [Stipitochalara longipes BDJ]|nr:hypothetical protein N431DRAFT_444839 [Stipitochalara longipes BDJ]
MDGGGSGPLHLAIFGQRPQGGHRAQGAHEMREFLVPALSVAVAQSLHCAALQCTITGGEEGEEGREGKEGREGREGREGDMSACRHVACRMSSSRRLLDRGENRVAIAATWTLQICACSPVRDPSGFRRARAQRCRPLSTTDGAPPAPPAPVKLQPKPPKQPSHPSRSLFPADTSTVENTARQPDSPSARIQRPVCQFARLALSGMPCFFPARFHVWAPLGLPSSGHPGRERGRGSVSMSAPVEYRLEIAPETGKHDLGLDRGQRTGSSFRVQQGQVGKWANERRLRDDYHSVSRALSTNGDRDLHTEGWAMLARLRQSGSDRRHATCSDCGAGCRPRDGWDFSRCNPGSLATRVGVPSPVRSTFLPNGCTHVVVNGVDGMLRGTATSEVPCRQCISPSTSCPSGFIRLVGPCCRDVKFHGLELGSSTAAQPFRQPAGADVLDALGDSDSDSDSDHPANLIHSRRRTPIRCSPASLSQAVCDNPFHLTDMTFQSTLEEQP